MLGTEMAGGASGATGYLARRTAGYFLEANEKPKVKRLLAHWASGVRTNSTTIPMRRPPSLQRYGATVANVGLAFILKLDLA